VIHEHVDRAERLANRLEPVANLIDVGEVSLDS
jgi:hypothetical protein